MNTSARALTTLLLCVLLVGFGVCGAYGTLMGLNAGKDPAPEAKAFSMIFFVPGAVGIVIALVCAWMIVKVWRKPPPGA